MGGLFGGGTISSTEQKLAGIQLQTSAYGLCIPVGYGQGRRPANLVYFSDFKAIPHTTTQSAKGGGPKVKNTTYTYTGTIMLAVQAGPIHSYQRQFSDKDIIASGNWSSWQKALGAYGQSVWSFLTGSHPTEADPYSGIAYVAKSAYDMGSTATLKNNSFETVGFLPVNAGASIYAASPAAIIKHMLTDPYDGMNFPGAFLDNLTSTSDCYKYTGARGLLFSPTYSEQSAVRDHLKLLAQAANCEFVWSGGVLKVVPYADANVSGSSTGTLINYVANVTPVYNLTDADYLPNGTEDPIRVTRTRPADAWNKVVVEFMDKALDYNTNIMSADDQANIELYGLRTGDPIKMHFITDAATAQLVAQIILQKKLYIRNVYEFRLGWRYALLEPMDLVTLTDTNLGLAQTTVRILKITEDDTGKLSVAAAEWPFGVATPALFSTTPGTGYAPNTQASPGNANTPVIFEPPVSMTNGEPEIWLASSGGADWGGADVWISLDGISYSLAGTIYKGCRHGTTTAAYTAGGASLPVDINASGGTLGNFDATSVSAAIPLFFVRGGADEIMSYTTATLTGTGLYTLSGLGKGLYGKPNANHANGAEWVRLDDAVMKMPLPQGVIGKLLYIKLVSFNTVGNMLQDIGPLLAHGYTPTGPSVGYALPTGVTVASTTTRPA